MPISPTDDDATAERTAAIVRDLTGPDATCTANHYAGELWIVNDLATLDAVAALEVSDVEDDD